MQVRFQSALTWQFVHVGEAAQHFGAFVQATFFIALAVASRLGTSALAAHQIVAQLWLLTSYVTDGFAVAGTVLGSRLAHQRHATVDSNDARYMTQITYLLFCVVLTLRDCRQWNTQCELPAHETALVGGDVFVTSSSTVCVVAAEYV